MRRLTRVLAAALLAASGLVILDVAVTLLWQEPVTAVYGALGQRQAGDELEQLEASFPSEADLGELEDVRSPSRRVKLLADAFGAEAEPGAAIGRLEGPAAGIDDVFVEGTDQADLEVGPGHYPATGLPGEGRTVAIAGHRTTYGAPFKDIDEFARGDAIELEMPYATAQYRVTHSRVVDPQQVSIIADAGRERLVLTACHPPFSAAERLAVFARLDRVRADQSMPRLARRSPQDPSRIAQ